LAALLDPAAAVAPAAAPVMVEGGRGGGARVDESGQQASEKPAQVRPGGDPSRGAAGATAAAGSNNAATSSFEDLPPGAADFLARLLGSGDHGDDAAGDDDEDAAELRAVVLDQLVRARREGSGVAAFQAAGLLEVFKATWFRAPGASDIREALTYLFDHMPVWAAQGDGCESEDAGRVLHDQRRAGEDDTVSSSLKVQHREEEPEEEPSRLVEDEMEEEEAWVILPGSRPDARIPTATGAAACTPVCRVSDDAAPQPGAAAAAAPGHHVEPAADILLDGLD